MEHKSYQQEKKEERISKLSSLQSVAMWLTEALELNKETAYKLDIDPVNKQARLYSTDEYACVKSADLIGEIILALRDLEDLAQHGCIILYKQRKSPVTLCNKSMTDFSHQYNIEEEILWKYIDCEIIVTCELEKYIGQGYMYFDDYLSIQNLEASKKNLRYAQISMIISILGAIISAFGTICC